MMRSNKNSFPMITDRDVDPEATEFGQDEAVGDEQVRVKNIVAGQIPSETLTVSNLRKFFIVKK